MSRRSHESVAVQTKFVGMMQYDGDLKLPARFLVPPPAISGVSGELLAKEGVTTFACSETQKFGHVSRAPPSAAVWCSSSAKAARMMLSQAIAIARNILKHLLLNLGERHRVKSENALLRCR